MLLAPSFSPKVQTVLDCLFNAVRALASRTVSSFSYSVVPAMPEEAREAALASRAAGAAQGTQRQPRRAAQHTPCPGSFPKLCWTWAGMRTCRRSLSFSAPALPCCVHCPAVAAVPDHPGHGRAQEGQRCRPGRAARLCAGAQTPSALPWPLSHRGLTATDTSGNPTGQAVAELSAQGHVFSIFNTAPSAVNKHCPQSACHLTELKKMWFRPPE